MSLGCSMPMALSPHSVGIHPPNPGMFIADHCNRKLLRTVKFDVLKPKATGDKESKAKTKSVICTDCEGNGTMMEQYEQLLEHFAHEDKGKQDGIPRSANMAGTVQCSQCKGSGVNPEDFFNGQFKAGDSCWLCGGRKEMLCGNCNGAGFVGGFLSGFDL